MNNRSHAIAILQCKYPNPTPLTFERLNNIFYQRFNSSNIGQYSAQIFTILSYSSVFEKYFLSFSPKLQQFIVMEASREPQIRFNGSTPPNNADSMKNIVDHVLLSFCIEDKYPQIVDCWTLQFYNLALKIQEVEPTQLDAINHLSDILTEIKVNNKIAGGSSYTARIDTIAYLLLALHGIEPIAEVLKSFPNHVWSLEPYQLTLLVENWKTPLVEDWKTARDIPTDWIFALLQNDF